VVGDGFRRALTSAGKPDAGVAEGCWVGVTLTVPVGVGVGGVVGCGLGDGPVGRALAGLAAIVGGR
jgi:hypothetical protein